MTPNMRDFLIIVGGAAIFGTLVSCVSGCSTEMTSEERFLMEQQRVADIIACKRDSRCFLMCNRLPNGRLNELRDCRPSIGGIR